MWSVPAVTIQDEPRFGFRGLLLDPVRCFIPKENVLRIIDCMAMLKINKLHFHLTDDNGWRIEIKKYPRLTEVGAWRVDRTDVPFHSRRNPKRGEPTPIGGFYTQEDIREIVAYAADRQIEVIPEIDVPAHSNAALAAYPQLACPVVKDFIGVLPGLGGRNSEIIYCAGNDSVFTFLQDIFDEILTLFPSRYIHVGGDEARKTNWEKCPLCQKRMKKQHLTNEEDLQGYFMKRISDYLRKKGREVIGWDELTNSSFLPEESIILGWQGMGTAALKAAEKGHRFIMTPARIMYLIRYQGPQWFEPVTYFGNNTLKDVFDYEPVQKDWKPEYESLLMGIQACMWTEFCNKPEDVDYLLFPRLAALAEVAQENLPAGYTYELGGMAREEAQSSGSTTGLIFILCFVFVYLLLSAQYESYILPLAVLLSIPFGLLGSFLFVNGMSAIGSISSLKMILGTMSNNIYMQIALIMLMGLLAKNAILIVEFALDRRKMGMSITWAAVLGAGARLRPILMTSLAMVVGLLPLMFAFGVGAHGNRTLGTASIGGMLIGMICQIFIVPALFVIFQYLQEKVKPMEWEDIDNADAVTEIEQYAK